MPDSERKARGAREFSWLMEDEKSYRFTCPLCVSVLNILLNRLEKDIFFSSSPSNEEIERRNSSVSHLKGILTLFSSFGLIPEFSKGTQHFSHCFCFSDQSAAP